jgi:mRNA interferase MazF
MAQSQTVNHPRRGEVYLVNFDPTLGAEIQKTRPALVVQNDIANRYSAITIVAAISSQFDESLYPTEVLVKAPQGGLRNNSVVLLNQVRSIDKQRLIQRLGYLRPETMARVDRAISISLGLIKI